jgi:ATP phosphoribosyltransferase
MKLKVAVQKGGRLSDKSLDLIKKCGIKIPNGGKLQNAASNFPLEVLYLRDDDIPEYVSTGVADLGIVGENVVLEKAREVEVISRLGFSKCRLSLAVKREVDYPGREWFEGKSIATSYPRIVSEFFEKNKINTRVETISGSVEIAPGIGLADGVCDIVSTGSTLLQNGLKEVESILSSEAVLIKNPNLDNRKSELLDRLLFRLKAVKEASRNKYILLNAPNTAIEKISNLLPGIKSPTIMPLAKEGWSSMHSVVPEDDFWEIIDKLKDAGAEGILVCPIEKMIS